MAVDVVQSRGGAAGTGGGISGLGARISAYVQGLPTAYRNVMAEMRRVTWPGREEIRKLSIGVILLSLGIGAIIWIIDTVLQTVLVRWIPLLFGGR